MDNNIFEAYGGTLNPDSREAYKHAEQYCESVRKMTTDIDIISKNLTVRYVTIPDVELVTEYTKDRIKELPQKNNFTQKTFAEVLGVTAKAVEKWESGERKPTGTANRLFQLIEKDPSIINAIVK